jgi:cyclopropane fatty-acyl-phospholipid synthase-like methyltransferase
MAFETIDFASLSTSEQHGVALLPLAPATVYSVGISTAGVAERYMAQTLLAQAAEGNRIFATTLDAAGADLVRQTVQMAGLERCIDVKTEDVTGQLPYPDDYFDFIYARLILHYLSAGQLDDSLASLFRTLKPDAKFYTVVRSDECLEYRNALAYDATTKLSTYLPQTDIPGQLTVPQQRYFHSAESITSHLITAGFEVARVERYDEQLYADFGRTILSATTDNVIEVVARKPAA